MSAEFKFNRENTHFSLFRLFFPFNLNTARHFPHLGDTTGRNHVVLHGFLYHSRLDHVPKARAQALAHRG